MDSENIKLKQAKATRYYDNFSKVYDIISSKRYYYKARNYAIQQLQLKEGDTVLNLPCGTGQNFEYFQKYLRNAGCIIGIDLSEGMLAQAKKKVTQNAWTNVMIRQGDATQITPGWISKNVGQTIQVDAILCDLGLSGFPDWKNVIDNLISILKPNGIIVIMDWYLPRPGLRAAFIKWIGKGEVDRPVYQYLQSKVSDFSVDNSFNRGGVFVASGIKKTE